MLVVHIALVTEKLTVTHRFLRQKRGLRLPLMRLHTPANALKR